MKAPETHYLAKYAIRYQKEDGPFSKVSYKEYKINTIKDKNRAIALAERYVKVLEGEHDEEHSPVRIIINLESVIKITEQEVFSKPKDK